MAVLAGHVKEAVHDDIGLVAAESRRHALDDLVAPPLIDGLVGVLGKAEIVHRIGVPEAAEGQRRVERTRGFLHLAGAQHAQHRTEFGADRILSALAACDRVDHGMDAVDVTQGREHGRGLVVGMGACGHDRSGGGQPFEAAVKRDDSGLELLLRDQVEIAERRRPGRNMGCRIHGG